MAISAYRGEKLKKHALRGTSLAVDPTRASERKTFGDLYSRARANPQISREALRESVASEFYGGARAKGLAAIAEARGQIGVLGGEISDIERRRSAAQSDIALSGEQAGRLAHIIRNPPYKQKKYRKRKRWQTAQLKKYGITSDFDVYKQGMGRTSWVQNLSQQKQALDYLKTQQPGIGITSWGEMQKQGPMMLGYLASLGMREQAAQKYLGGGSLASLADKRAQLGGLQRSIQQTYVPTAEKARVYSGFFGGA